MASVTLAELREFLPSQGFQLIAAPDEFIEVWRAESIVGSELLLPTERAADQEIGTREALAKLALLSNVTVKELEQTIREFSDNTISIRVVHSDVSEGSIPLEDGIALNANAKELLAAAANATLERRALYQGRQPAAVASLIQNARLGQTTHGSYVIHVFCRDTIEELQQPVSFARAATQTLHTALSGLREAVNDYESSGNSLAFERALGQGASANLCEAVAKLSGKDRSRTVEISLQPSPRDSLIQPPRATVEFHPSHQTTIRIAADYFRQTYTLANEVVMGAVERLDRRVEQDDGTIRIAATLSNGAQRSVGVLLTSEEYQAAIHAHENKQVVRITGDIVVTPRTANMVEPRGFAVLGNYELF